MQVKRVAAPSGRDYSYELYDETGQPLIAVSDFLQHLAAREYSPNTLAAYAYDLRHLFNFFEQQHLNFLDFSTTHSFSFLQYLKSCSSHNSNKRLSLTLCTTENGQSATRLSPTTINRIFAAVSSFYEYLLLSGLLETPQNPILKVPDTALAKVSERHQPFMGHASRQQPVRRALRVKTVQRLPRPMEEPQFRQLLGSFIRLRDKALLLLMCQGGLRPGEVLNLHLEDIQYGRKRVIIRFRTDHPHGVRTKSRTERVVDLYEPETLATLSQYVMQERPTETNTSLVFLVGGKGTKRCQPLSYHALIKAFERHCERLDIRQPWLTPHALRHTHATRMWEGGMRELSLQKRLGHASPESTRIYTRVSEAQVVAEYRQALVETNGTMPKQVNHE